MTKAQIEAFKKITPGPWSAEWDDNGQWYVEPLGLTGTKLRGDSGECIESATAKSIAALPDLLAEREKMIEMLKEMREGCAACFRVIAVSSESHIDMLDSELKAGGIKDGFGKRCENLIAEAEGGE